jgi:chromosome segregation ATPase
LPLQRRELLVLARREPAEDGATGLARRELARITEVEHRAQAAHEHGEQLAQQIAELQHRAAEAGHAAGEAEHRIAAGEQRVEVAEQRVQAAEQRAVAAEGNAQALARQIAEMQRAQGAEGNAQALARQTAEMQAQIAELEREVANADNVRSFAAETEREIAALQRDLRDTRAKLAQMTLERDRLESEVRDARGDDITNQRAVAKPGFDPDATVKPGFDADATAQVNIAKYESLAAKTSELEQKLQHMERDDAALRRRLAEAEERLRLAAIDLEDDSELTRTGSQLPIAELAEHVTTLEESINSLRANMRAASDETAMMDPSESVSTISSAVSQAAEHVEVARAAIRALAATIGMS